MVFYEAWSSTTSITVTNPPSATGYPVKFTLTFRTGMNTDFSDIRFSDGTQELSYWIESYVAGTSAVVWVKLIKTSTDATPFTIHYGNEDAESESSGTDTFSFYDGCTSISDWTVGSGTWGVTTVDGVPRIYQLNGDSVTLYHNTYKPAWNENHILEYTIRFSADNDWGGGVIYPYTLSAITSLIVKLFAHDNQISVYWGGEAKSTYPTVSGTDYNVRVVYTQTHIHVYINDYLKIDSGMTSPTGYTGTDTFKLLGGLTTGYTYWSNIKVRLYAATEPTCSVSDGVTKTIQKNVTYVAEHPGTAITKNVTYHVLGVPHWSYGVPFADSRHNDHWSYGVPVSSAVVESTVTTISKDVKYCVIATGQIAKDVNYHVTIGTLTPSITKNVSYSVGVYKQFRIVGMEFDSNKGVFVLEFGAVDDYYMAQDVKNKSAHDMSASLM